MKLKVKSGFTIIELSISMAFVSVLLVSITMFVMSLTKIYTKGITIKAVNSNARFVIDDMRPTVTASPRLDGGYFPANAGRFCSGSYSYIWNSAQNILAARPTPSSSINYNLLPNRYDTDDDFIKLVKVLDPHQIYCVPNASGVFPRVPRDGAIVLIPTDDEADLALYDFQVLGSSSPVRTVYAASFVLGTLRGTTTTSLSGAISTTNQCNAPAADQAGDFDYCSINKFNFVMMATGTGR